MAGKVIRIAAAGVLGVTACVSSLTPQARTALAYDGSSIVRATPQGFMTGSISAGPSHTCGIKTGGTIVCWGDDTYGELNGNPNAATHSGSPPGGGTFVSVSTGNAYTCAIRVGGSVLCWGDDSAGQVDGTAQITSPYYSQGAAPGLGADVVQISAGSDHTCAVLATGAGECWGLDDNGQIDGVPEAAGCTCTVAAPPKVNPPYPNVWTQLSSGAGHTCGILESGAAFCYGDDANGEIDGTAVGTYVQSAPPGGGVYSQISAADFYTCGLRAGGSPLCWGYNVSGQVNGLPNNPQRGAVGVPPGVGPFTRISASNDVSSGQGHVCGLKADGTVYCWGFNYQGEVNGVANGTYPYYNAGTAPGGTYIAIAVGAYHSCGIKSTGSAYCWGYNADGEVNGVPNPTAPNSSTGGPPGGGTFDAPAAAAGLSHTCLVKAAGSVTCTGSDASGQLDGTPSAAVHTGSPPGGGTFVQVAAGDAHSCGLTSGRLIKCWGSNSAGQTIVPAGNFVQLAAGGNHSCGLRITGSAVCWGDENLVAAGPFIQLLSGQNDSCGITVNFIIDCWGDNTYHQIYPSGFSGFADATLGARHLCTVQTDPSYYYGQSVLCYGDNTYTQNSPPVTGEFNQLAAGYFHTCGLGTDGVPTCWGKNNAGQADAPAGTFDSLAGGGSHSCGIQPSGTMICWGAAAGFSSTGPAAYKHLRVRVANGYTTMTWRGVSNAVGYNVLLKGVGLNQHLIRGHSHRYRFRVAGTLHHATISVVERFR